MLAAEGRMLPTGLQQTLLGILDCGQDMLPEQLAGKDLVQKNIGSSGQVGVELNHVGRFRQYRLFGPA